MAHLLAIVLGQTRMGGLGLLADASANDGMAGWNELVKGVQKTLDHNSALVGPAIGLTVLAVVILLAYWKLVSWFARLWERHNR